ncbi:MAG: glycogen-binding domain-containing protein [Phycisphaerae bacterium]
MFSKGRRSATFRFSFRSPGDVKEVLVAGSFNQWKPVTMRKQKNGSFAVTLAIPAGTYEYKFIVDGHWMTDPDNASYVPNPYGTVNSVAKAA